MSSKPRAGASIDLKSVLEQQHFLGRPTQSPVLWRNVTGDSDPRTVSVGSWVEARGGLVLWRDVVIPHWPTVDAAQVIAS